MGPVYAPSWGPLVTHDGLPLRPIMGLTIDLTELARDTPSKWHYRMTFKGEICECFMQRIYPSQLGALG